MEIWLDTCDEDFIRRHSSLGVIEGVTTNPTIIRGQDLKKLIPLLLEAQSGWVAVQVHSGSAQAMFNQAENLAAISSRILVKVPTHTEGLKCMGQLAQKQIPFLATAIFTPTQALLAFKTGATYLAPYIGRIEDEKKDPWTTLEAIQGLKNRYGYKSKILSASLRTPEAIERCAHLGLDAVTVRPALFEEWLTPPSGLVQSLKKWQI